MSGYTDEAMASHGWSDGVRNLLEKPFSSTELLRKVRRVFDGA
jgi:FixJ family two-component response regulator